MKVRFVIDMQKSLEGSGIYSSAVRLATHLRNQEIQVDINEKGGKTDIIHFHTALPQSWLFVKRLAAKKPKSRPKIVMHAHTTVEDFQGSFFLSDQLNWLLYPYLSSFYKKADAVVAVSDYVRNVILSNYGVSEDKIVVISNGIDFRKVQARKSEMVRKRVRNYLELKEDDLLVISVGIKIHRKAPDIFTEVSRRLPDITFYWVGRCYPVGFLSHARQARKDLKTAKKLKNLFFTGYVSNKTLWGLYNAADVFFYPTREENQGIALLEAISYGKILQVRDLPVFSFLKSGEDCLKGNSVQDFVTNLEWVGSHANKAKKMAKNSEKHLPENDLELVAKKMASLYHTLVE